MFLITSNVYRCDSLTATRLHVIVEQSVGSEGTVVDETSLLVVTAKWARTAAGATRATAGSNATAGRELEGVSWV